MIKKILCFFLCLYALKAHSQNHQQQNGIKTSVINAIKTDDASAKRFLVAELGYNSHHWQVGGAVVIELYSPHYSTGYQKYTVECSYGRGTDNTPPKVQLREAYGVYHSAKVSLGTPSNMSTSYLGYDNLILPIYVDVEYYATYIVKITYMQDKVEQFTAFNQIKIYDAPTGASVASFASPQVDTDIATTGLLQLSGSGNHYVMGNLGIGTETPQEKLSVNGKIRAKEIKVETANWPDYVFSKDYKLPDLKETETFIKTNGHLPGVPSATVAEQEGIELGEMNKILLKKVEELTLHLIELKKENETIKNQIIELKKNQ